jgi:hypothetical protein
MMQVLYQEFFLVILSAIEEGTSSQTFNRFPLYIKEWP